MSVFAPDLKITARASYYGQHLLFVVVASFVDNNCPGDNFYIFSSCRFTTHLVLFWTTIVPRTIILFSSCLFTTLLVLLRTPCSCQRRRCGRRCCPPHLERLLPRPGIVYNCAWRKILNSFFSKIVLYWTCHVRSRVCGQPCREETAQPRCGRLQQLCEEESYLHCPEHGIGFKWCVN